MTRLSERAVRAPHLAPRIRWAPDVYAPLIGLPWPIVFEPIDWDARYAELRARIRAEERMARLVYGPPQPLSVLQVY